MPRIPVSQASPAIAEAANEIMSRKYREEADAQLRRLQTEEFDPAAIEAAARPMIADIPLRGMPTYRQQSNDSAGGLTELEQPEIDDPLRNMSSLGEPAPLTSAEMRGEPQAGELEAGIGGPPNGISDADIINLRDRKAAREKAREEAETRSRLMDSPTTPDQAASDLDIATRSGVNRIEVEQNRETFTAADQARDIDQVYEKAPLLRDWAKDRANFDVARDDLNNLSWWETTGAVIAGVPGAFDAGVKDMAAQGWGLGQALNDLDRWVSQQLFGTSPDDVNFRLTESLASAKRGQAKTAADAAFPQINDPTARGVLSGVRSIPLSTTAAATGALTGGVAPGLMLAGGMVGGEKYGEARDQGLSAEAAAAFGAGHGGIEALTELIPMKWLVGDIVAKTPFVQTLAKQFIAEAPSEQVATATQDFLDWAVLPENADKTFNDYLEARPGAAYETFLATLVGTGAQTTAIKAANDSISATVDAMQQKRAEDLKRTFDAMAQGAKDSKLLKRIPDKYREAVAQVTKDGPLENVRVTSEAMTELAQSNGLSPEQLAQAFRIDPADMNAAIASGDDVVIPAGNYAATMQTAKKELGISGEAIHTALSPNMRLRADDFTLKEREAMQAVFEEEQKARTEGETRTQEFADSADRVREAIREQVAGTKIFNTETANTQAAIAGEMVVTLAERTGRDPEKLWKEMGFDVVAALTGEQEDDALLQGGDRIAMQVDDATVTRASEELSEYAFAIWKAATLQGKANRDIASDEEIAEVRAKAGRGERDAMPSPETIQVILGQARAKGLPVPQAKLGRGDSFRAQVEQLLDEGLNSTQIHERLGRPAELRNATNAMVSKIKKARKDSLQQEKRGSFSPRSDRNVIRLFESSNLSTFVHEASHWYLDTLWRMSKVENPHPFVLEQLAAVLEWHGKSPNWDAMFAEGRFTEEGRDLQEAFAESFEAYLREGKAPSTSLRSVFATIKQWLLGIYKSLRSIGTGRVNLNPEIAAVFDRMLATDEAIKAASAVMERDGEAMAKALLDKGVITQKAFERTKTRLQAAREKAEAELMARLMEDYERNQKAWWRDEERQIRREVQSEIDERPEQRAFAWLSGRGWRDTRAEHTEAAATEADAMALIQARELVRYTDFNATDGSIRALQQRMLRDGKVPAILLFRSPDTNRVIALSGEEVDYSHDIARTMLGLGDMKLDHGVWNPRLWPTLAEMNAGGRDAWYETTGIAKDTGLGSRALAQTAQGPVIVYRGSAEDEAGVIENGRLGLGLYSAEDPEIGAEWGGQTGKVDAYRINGRLFDLDAETSRGLENYEKQEDTPAAQKLFARLKQEGYVGVRDPWSGHINVFADNAMERLPERDTELGSTWTNEEALAQLDPRSFKRLREASQDELLEWYNENVEELTSTTGAGKHQRDHITLAIESENWRDINIDLSKKQKDGFFGWNVEMTFEGRLGAEDEPSARTARQAQIVFAKTVAALRAFVLKNKPPFLLFTGSGEAQEKLYDFMFRTLDFAGYEARIENFKSAMIRGDIQVVPPTGIRVFSLVRPDLAPNIPIDLDVPHVSQVGGQTNKAFRFTEIVRPSVRAQQSSDQGRGRGGQADDGGDALLQAGDGQGRVSPPPTLPPMRLDLNSVREQYGEEGLAGLPPQVRAYSTVATDVDQFVQIARDVRKTLNQKPPKSLWKFLASRRVIGHGNDKIAYSGIEDNGEFTASFIGAEPPKGLFVSPSAKDRKTRPYTMSGAVMAAWEEGYFAGSPPSPEVFIEALRNDVDGTNPRYAKTDLATVQEIRDAGAWEQWFDANGIDIAAPIPELRAKLETVLTGQAENAISPDDAAPFFKMPDGNALLQGLKQGPQRDALIRAETQRRMIERHGDPFRDGTIMREAETFARNEVAQRQIEIELEALAKAAGKQFASNLAKQTAQENLRTKQVREVLNYNQWLILEQRWGKKALEAAEKGDFAKAAEYKRYQLVNLHMFREGRKMAEEIEKARKHLLDYSKKTKQQRLFEAGADYAAQMNGLLEDYQLRPESRRQEAARTGRAQWIAQQMAAIDPYSSYQDPSKTPQEQAAEAAEALDRSAMLNRLAEGSQAQNYKSLAVEAFFGVRDEADMIWKLATLKDRLLKEAERKRLTLAAEDIAAEIEANQPNQKPPEPLETDAFHEKLKRSGMKYFAMHRTMQSLGHQFAGGKDGGVFIRYIVRPLNEAYAALAGLRITMGKDLDKLFSVYTKAEQARFYKDRIHFASIGASLTKQGRLAVALNWGNEKNRKRLMDSTGWTEQSIQQILDTLDKRDWDFVQSAWDYLDSYFAEANRVHENVHGAPMDKEAPLEIATRFGIYKGGYYPIKYDPDLSSKAGQRQIEAEAKAPAGKIGARYQPGFSKSRVQGKVTLPLKLSVIDVLTQHLDQVATSIATEEALFDAGRLLKHPAVENAIITRHGRQIYNTLVNTLVTSKFGLEGASGVLAHLRNGATVVGLGWKVATALLQPLGVTNSIVRVGGYWMAKGYARMGTDALTIQSSAKWIMDRSEFMRHRRQSQSPELAALKQKMKKDSVTPRWILDSMFALMTNTQFYSVDMPTWYGAYYKAEAAGLDEGDRIAQADQAVIDAQGSGDLHATAAIQTGAGTKYAAALRLLTNFMSYMVTTYNLSMQRVRNTRTPLQAISLTMDMVLMLSVPVAGKMLLDAWTKGGDDDDDPLWEKYGREQIAFLLSPFVGVSQVAGAVRGDDSFGYRGPAGLGVFAEATRAGAAAAELDFDESFWRPANKTAGMIFHYPASQLDATVRGSMALWNGETTNPAVIFFGPPPN